MEHLAKPESEPKLNKLASGRRSSNCASATTTAHTRYDLEHHFRNLNLRTKHRFERVVDKDTYADCNLDWMGSLWVKDRISANHMEHSPGVLTSEKNDVSIN